jgi:uncharacterized protein
MRTLGVPAHLIDTNVWVAATFSSHVFHLEAKQFLSELNTQNQAAFCRSTQQSFLRLATTSTVFKFYGVELISNRAATEILTAYLAQPTVTSIREPDNVFDLWQKLAALDSASPKVWMDAYLAAFAICKAIPLVSFDQDFKRFKADGLQLTLLGFK